MSLAIIYSRASSGISAPLISIETHIARGLPRFYMVGLPETEVKESRDRVRSAIQNSGFEFPRGRITVNLAPADLPKEGGRFDLPIALGILAASKQIPIARLLDHEFTGELALSGEIRPIKGVLPVVIAATQDQRQLIVPYGNEYEAALVKQENVFSAKHLLEVAAYLRNEMKLPNCVLPEIEMPAHNALDLKDVRGQHFAKRALEVAAAGKHSILFIGPPGTGKTMLATRLPTILPQLNDEQALEVAAVASISASGFEYKNWQKLPFRSPHHTSSSFALVGGGRPPRPGEISLAHHGVLFLDELPEYNRQVLESLREPLESGRITISRAAYQAVFPAHFQLIAAMNPCPCGHAGNTRGNCNCTEEQVHKYISKLSGPLLDRIDMHVQVPALATDILASAELIEETSAAIKERIINARYIQAQRQNKCNAELAVRETEQFCILPQDASQLLKQAMEKFNLSARVYHRVIKIARTIADLSGCKNIEGLHISEALSYRCLDKS